MDAFAFVRSDVKHDELMVQDKTPAEDTFDQLFEKQDDPMFEDYLESEEHLFTLKEEYEPSGHEVDRPKG
jgi:hypothetical protein